jgi:hypothetical protein
MIISVSIGCTGGTVAVVIAMMTIMRVICKCVGHLTQEGDVEAVALTTHKAAMTIRLGTIRLILFLIAIITASIDIVIITRRIRPTIAAIRREAGGTVVHGTLNVLGFIVVEQIIHLHLERRMCGRSAFSVLLSGELVVVVLTSW